MPYRKGRQLLIKQGLLLIIQIEVSIHAIGDQTRRVVVSQLQGAASGKNRCDDGD